ncbi:unnamed protein product [Fraxinus pennsylvanica]|uniref:Acetyl-coenzyme A synthetase n=1 Tax=Fraxinus pennsylvanica TaxID=56036 RepID=A0AAD1ZBN9_9LAMI|nr:unnamed protein product [Fraxinus pennsylvanica]
MTIGADIRIVRDDCDSHSNVWNNFKLKPNKMSQKRSTKKSCIDCEKPAPDKIHWAPRLPKTRSGKIMRRILRKIVSRQLDELGDTSTLADPSVIDQLVALADS